MMERGYQGEAIDSGVMSCSFVIPDEVPESSVQFALSFPRYFEGNTEYSY